MRRLLRGAVDCFLTRGRCGDTGYVGTVGCDLFGWYHNTLYCRLPKGHDGWHETRYERYRTVPR